MSRAARATLLSCAAQHTYFTHGLFICGMHPWNRNLHGQATPSAACSRREQCSERAGGGLELALRMGTRAARAVSRGISRGTSDTLGCSVGRAPRRAAKP